MLPRGWKVKPSPVATGKVQVRERLNGSYFWACVKIVQDCFSRPLPFQANGSGKKWGAWSYQQWPHDPFGVEVVFQRHQGTHTAGAGQWVNELGSASHRILCSLSVRSAALIRNDLGRMGSASPAKKLWSVEWEWKTWFSSEQLDKQMLTVLFDVKHSQENSGQRWTWCCASNAVGTPSSSLIFMVSSL